MKQAISKTFSFVNPLKLAIQMTKYNLKIVFANRFIYFLIAALALFLLIAAIFLFSSSATIKTADIYGMLLLPGILIMFYPVIYGLQNDKDARMLEMLFGVPNYRYKVYLLRYAISLLVMVAALLLMATIALLAIMQFPLFEVVYQLLYPLLFLSALAFLMTTLVKNASGSAVVMIILGLIFWVLSENLRFSKWNIFINPFDIPTDMSYSVFKNVLYQNRLMMVIGTVVSILWSLLNLQKREQYV